jgi:acyl carrier protein
VAAVFLIYILDMLGFRARRNRGQLLPESWSSPMSRADFLRRIVDILEVPPASGTLTGAEACADVEGWDSLAMLSFIALLDKEFGVKVAPVKIAQCETVNDLVDLVGDRLSP